MATGGAALQRGSAAAAVANLRRRRTDGGAGGAAGGASGTKLQFNTDDDTGLKISPNAVLMMIIGFIAFVAILMSWACSVEAFLYPTTVVSFFELLKNIDKKGLPFLSTLNPPYEPKHILLKWSTSHPVPSVAASKASSSSKSSKERDEYGSLERIKAMTFMRMN